MKDSTKVAIGLAVTSVLLIGIAGAAAKKGPASDPLGVRTIEVPGIVTYKVFKLGNGFFKILAYAPGTENLGSGNELAEFNFGPDGPQFVWGDSAILERLQKDMQRFPADLFSSASTTLTSATGDDDRRTVLA